MENKTHTIVHSLVTLVLSVDLISTYDLKPKPLGFKVDTILRERFFEALVRQFSASLAAARDPSRLLWKTDFTTGTTNKKGSKVEMWESDEIHLYVSIFT